MTHKKENEPELHDIDLGDILIHDLAKQIEAGLELKDHYFYSEQSDLFEYEEKLEVEAAKLGLDIIEQIRNNNGK